MLKPLTMVHIAMPHSNSPTPTRMFAPFRKASIQPTTLPPAFESSGSHQINNRAHSQRVGVPIQRPLLPLLPEPVMYGIQVSLRPLRDIHVPLALTQRSMADLARRPADAGRRVNDSHHSPFLVPWLKDNVKPKPQPTYPLPERHIITSPCERSTAM
jgi:hypothetical protein